MFVQCSLCGGENQRAPGQAMLVCSFCGASLALEERTEIERLILSHTRDDAAAEASLRSHLAENDRRRATRAAVDFSFIPFSMVEDDDNISIVPAARAWTKTDQAPYPPAGKYEFLAAADEKETIVPADREDPRARRMIHLPVYSIAYETGGFRGHASVIGESWQVIAPQLPPERARRPGAGAGLAALALFAAYFAIARIATGFFGRFAAVGGAAAAGYIVFSLRARGRR